MNESSPQKERSDTVVIKKYANRRLYNTETSTYVTLEDLAEMVRADRDFLVRDAKSNTDLTHTVLTQIIVEQESRAGGQTLLPIPFLRQLIRYYDDSVGKLVPGYLQFSLEALTKERDRFKSQFSNNPWGPSAFEAYQDQARRNVEVFERAMAMWSPFNPAANNATASDAPTTSHAQASGGASPAPQSATKPTATNSVDKPNPTENTGAAAGSEKASPPKSKHPEIDELKAELAAMQQRIESLSRS